MVGLDGLIGNRAGSLVLCEICQAKSMEQSLDPLHYNMVLTIYSPVTHKERRMKSRQKKT